MDRVETIKIVDEGTPSKPRHMLYINDCQRAFATVLNHRVSIHWLVHGPQSLDEAHVLMQGLLDLFMIADQLKGGTNGRKAKK